MSIMKIKRSVKNSVAVVFTIIGILLALGVGAVTYVLSHKRITAQYTDVALSTANMAAALVDGDAINSYLKNGPDAAYHSTRNLLKELKTTYDLNYLYILRPDNRHNDGVYIFDIHTEGGTPSLPGELGKPTGEIDNYDIVLEIYLSGYSHKNPLITETYYGRHVTAYAPVYTPERLVAAVIGVDISMDRVIRDALAQTFEISIAALLIIALFFVILLFIIQHRILNPIIRFSRHIESIDSYDDCLRKFEPRNTGDELYAVAEGFNRMVDDVYSHVERLTHLATDHERIAAELGIATQIQKGMLPCTFPAFPDREDFDIYATMQAAKEVGGDFYDFFFVDKHTLAVVIADVSGKGVPAALFMVIAKTLINNNARSENGPKEIFETVNNLLCENNDSCMFVTAFMGYYDLRTGRFVYVNAGHNPPLLKRADGDFRFLKGKPSLFLAGMENTTYREDEIVLGAGDVLYLYTDGVTEAMNSEHEMFSEERLFTVANRYKDRSIRDLLSSINQEVKNFEDGMEQSDDITMLALKINQAQRRGGIMKEIIVRAISENLNEVMDFIDAELEANNCAPKLHNQINIAVEEIFINIANYAYEPETGDAVISVSVDENVTVVFEDRGKPYNPMEQAAPDLDKPAVEREIGGLGIFMVKKLMDSMEYLRDGDKNVLTIRKRLNEK